MEAVLVAKDVRHVVGDYAPLYVAHLVGSVFIPNKRIYLASGKGHPLELYYKDKGVVNMVNVDLFIEMGRKIYGDDSFFGKIDVDDEKVEKILEMQRLIEETPKNLAMLINEILSSVTPSVLC